MRFNRIPFPTPDAALDRLAGADRFVVAAGRFGVLAALVVGVGTGAYLLRGEARGELISYATLRGVHSLAGLVLLVQAACRLCGVAAAALARLFSARRGGWKPHPVAFRLGPGRALSAADWIALMVMLLSGTHLALAARYGWFLLPDYMPLPWALVHRIGFYYLAALLLLRLFFWSGAYLRTVIPYLRSP